MQEDAVVRRCASQAGTVLLYHATYSEIPRDLDQDLHNVTPNCLEQQLSTLSRYFTFVPVDELCQSRDPRGLASVTVDDGYRSFFDEALPVFESLSVPVTVFVNQSLMSGGAFWRDKVRYLIKQGMEDKFRQRYGHLFEWHGRRFYRATKLPHNNSVAVEAAIDRFLSDEGMEPHFSQHYGIAPDHLIHHPLLWYGSHTVSHYVMSSLDDEEQMREIEDNRAFLLEFPDIQSSELLSIPFGGGADYNRKTLELTRAFGYKGALLSRGHLHFRYDTQYGLAVCDRIMPREESIAMSLGRAVSDRYSGPGRGKVT